MNKILDIKPTLEMRMEQQYYDYFCNQKARSGEIDKKSNRTLFKHDYQRYLWAFILGIKKGVRKPLSGKTAGSFKWEIIQRRNNVAQLMVGLVIQEKYKDNVDKLREDFEKCSEEGTSFSDALRLAIEEYANTGFDILMQKSLMNPGYIEDINIIVEDILKTAEL